MGRILYALSFYVEIDTIGKSMYSQKPLIELFCSGKFPGESGVPKHIETVISNVFLFERKVYKVYKNDNDFFNSNYRDLSGREDRFIFTKKDFEWNNDLSPSIYTSVQGITAGDDMIHVVSEYQAEELILIMNRVDTKDLLYEKLIQNLITEQDCYMIGTQLAKHLKGIKRYLPDFDFSDVFDARITDLRNWIQSVTDHISTEESGMYCDFLQNFNDINRSELKEKFNDSIAFEGDFHSQNALFTNKQLFLMDTYPPKEEWGIGHQLTSVYRVGADIWALSGKESFFQAFLSGFMEEGDMTIEKKFNPFFVVYASGIMVSYLYMLAQTDPEKMGPAQKYHNFLRTYFSEHCA